MVALNEAVKVREEMGGDSVVGVNEGDESTTTDSKAGVAGAGKTLVGLMENASARVAGGETVADVAADVGGTVIHEDDLEMGIGLGPDGEEAALDGFGGIVNGDDDRDEGEVRVGLRSGEFRGFGLGRLGLGRLGTSGPVREFGELGEFFRH